MLAPCGGPLSVGLWRTRFASILPLFLPPLLLIQLVPFVCEAFVQNSSHSELDLLEVAC